MNRAEADLSRPEAPEAAVDFLCIAPHTDDAEIGLGGTLRLLADRGRRVWVCDLTRGELASNATPDERWGEAGAASRLLGLTGRIQLALPDGFIDPHDPVQVGALTGVIRRLRPRWVASTPEPRRHPDHVATPQLVARAVFLAHLSAYLTDPPVMRLWPQETTLPAAVATWHCEAVFETCPLGEPPSLIFDCSRTWQVKQEAIATFRSQFSREVGRRPTMINDAAWLENIERRGRYWGFKAGVAHGEALRSQATPVLADLPEAPWS